MRLQQRVPQCAPELADPDVNVRLPVLKALVGCWLPSRRLRFAPTLSRHDMRRAVLGRSLDRRSQNAVVDLAARLGLGRPVATKTACSVATRQTPTVGVIE